MRRRTRRNRHSLLIKGMRWKRSSRKLYAEIKSHVESAGKDVLNATAAHTVNTMNKATGLEISSFSIWISLLWQSWFETSLVEGNTLNEWLSNLESNTVNRILQAQRSALVEGDSLSGMIKKLRVDGFEGSYSGLKGLARTAMLSAANFARDTAISSGFGDVLDGWQFLATLDNRTCIECGSLDGKIYGLDEPKPPVPLHWQCRCCYVPIVKSLEGLPDASEERPSVTDEETGIYPGSYNEWLQAQLESDPYFVRDILGPGRYELFKHGKITLQNMVTNGQINKLSDLV